MSGERDEANLSKFADDTRLGDSVAQGQEASVERPGQTQSKG